MNNPTDTTAQCAWCGSLDTEFLGYDCWEENEIGNTIRVDSLATEYTPRDEIWWCNNCEGETAYMFEEREELILSPPPSVEQIPPQPPEPPPPPTEGKDAPHHDTASPPSA